jgi:hypothetical protein
LRETGDTGAGVRVGKGQDCGTGNSDDSDERKRPGMTPVRSSSHRIPGPVPRSRSFTADVRRRYRCHTLARSPTPAPVSRRVSIAHRRRYHAGPLSLIGTGTTVSFFYRRLHQCQSFHARSRSHTVTDTVVTPGLAGSPLPALVSRCWHLAANIVFYARSI